MEKFDYDTLPTTNRPETFDDLKDWDTAPHVHAKAEVDSFADKPEMLLAWSQMLTAAERNGYKISRDKYSGEVMVIIPRTVDELEKALDTAQRSYDTRRENYARCSRDGVDDWHAVWQANQYAEIEGLQKFKVKENNNDQ